MKNTSSASSPSVSSRNKPGKVLGKLIPLLLIFGALTAPWIGKSLSGDSKTAPRTEAGGVDWRQSSAQVRKSLEQAKTEAAQAEVKVWREFAKRMDEAKKANRRDTDAGVEAAVRTLVQKGEIGWLIADYAQDKVLGGDRAKKRIAACSGSFTRSLRDSTVRVHGLVDALQQDLVAVNNRYAITVGEVIEQQGTTLPRPNFEHLMRVREKVPFAVTLEVGGAGAAATFELVTVRATKNSIVQVYRFLARKLAPQIAKAAVGTGAAVVDGPLPIGDIVTVGLAIWTVYDLASLPGAIREDVRKEFSHAAAEHHRLLDKQVNAAVGDVAKQSLQKRKKLHEQLLSVLP